MLPLKETYMENLISIFITLSFIKLSAFTLTSQIDVINNAFLAKEKAIVDIRLYFLEIKMQNKKGK